MAEKATAAVGQPLALADHNAGREGLVATRGRAKRGGEVFRRRPIIRYAAGLLRLLVGPPHPPQVGKTPESRGNRRLGAMFLFVACVLRRGAVYCAQEG